MRRNLLLAGLLSVVAVIAALVIAFPMVHAAPRAQCGTAQCATVYDTKSLLNQPNVKVVPGPSIRNNVGPSKGASPDTPIHNGLDQGYYDISINWVYQQLLRGGHYVWVFSCGYIFTDVESITGPVAGALLQGTLNVFTGGFRYNPWTIDIDREGVTGIAEESGCYNYGAGAYWYADGSGLLEWPDGNFGASGTVAVAGNEPS